MENVVGICQIQVKDLYIDKRLARRARKKKHRENAVSDMKEILLAAPDTTCPRYFLSVAIFSDELDVVLSTSGYSLTDLTLTEPYIRLTPPRKLLCLHGWKRYTAARSIDAGMWWTVRLQCLPRGVDPLRIFLKDVEEENHETPQSDGDIYFKLWYYRGQDEHVKRWLLKLTPSKRKAVRRLLGKDLKGGPWWVKDLVKQLDNLLQFPGLWAGFELGNIEKHLSLRSICWILNYLRHIEDVWNRITLGKPEIRAAVDEITVEKLQQLVPFCMEDGEHISHLMRSHAIFSDVKSPDVRGTIEAKILQERCLIPSIKSLHENLKYFSIGISVIKKNLLGGLERGESILAALGKLWRKPDACIIEYDEGCFQHVSQAADLELHVLQVFLSAVRSFLFPKHDPEAIIETAGTLADMHQFLRCVQYLGFNSAKIEAAAAAAATAGAPAKRPASTATGVEEPDVRRRWGRPHATTWNSVRERLFIGRLYEYNDPAGTFPTALFIQKDFITSFFGTTATHPALAFLSQASVSRPIGRGGFPSLDASHSTATSLSGDSGSAGLAPHSAVLSTATRSYSGTPSTSRVVSPSSSRFVLSSSAASSDGISTSGRSILTPRNTMVTQFPSWTSSHLASLAPKQTKSSSQGSQSSTGGSFERSFLAPRGGVDVSPSTVSSQTSSIPSSIVHSRSFLNPCYSTEIASLNTSTPSSTCTRPVASSISSRSFLDPYHFPSTSSSALERSQGSVYTPRQCRPPASPSASTLSAVHSSDQTSPLKPRRNLFVNQAALRKLEGGTSLAAYSDDWPRSAHTPPAYVRGGYSMSDGSGTGSQTSDGW